MNIDPFVERLVDALNEIEGVNTSSSCEGHEHHDESQVPYGTFYVNFSVDYNKRGWKALEYIVKAIQRHWDVTDNSTIALVPWFDGGLEWELRGEYENKEEINDFASFIENADCLGVND